MIFICEPYCAMLKSLLVHKCLHEIVVEVFSRRKVKVLHFFFFGGCKEKQLLCKLGTNDID